MKAPLGLETTVRPQWGRQKCEPATEPDKTILKTKMTALKRKMSAAEIATEAATLKGLSTRCKHFLRRRLNTAFSLSARKLALTGPRATLNGVPDAEVS
jgi:hypothetical protein